MTSITITRLLTILICVCGVLAAQVPPLFIADEALPAIDAVVEFHMLLHATGGVPPYVWSIASGDLPDGVTLTPEGLLSGRAAKPGTSTFTLKVEDSGHPAHTITKDFRAVVAASMLLEWLQPPKVHDNRIDGAVQVSNGSADTFDLTVIIVAVAENGRATAIGYEHFPLKAAATSLQIPFTNTLPHHTYLTHPATI